MGHDSWLFIAYGIGLFFLSLKTQYVKDPNYLRLAWISYVCAIFVTPVVSLFKAISYSVPREERFESTMIKEFNLADIIAGGIFWALVGVSLLFFIAAVFPNDEAPPSIKNKTHSTLFGDE
jgi:hypothetical protein